MTLAAVLLAILWVGALGITIRHRLTAALISIVLGALGAAYAGSREVRAASGHLESGYVEPTDASDMMRQAVGFFALASPFALCAAAWSRLRLSARAGDKCLQCGYSLSGLPGVRCPECGATASRPLFEKD